MIRGRSMRTGGGCLCIVLGIVSLACGANDTTLAFPDGGPTEVALVATDAGALGDADAQVTEFPDGLVTPDDLVNDEPVLAEAPRPDVVDDEPEGPRASSACATEASIGAGVHERPWLGVDRRVIVHVPEGGAGRGPAPLVFSLHGAAASAASHDAYLHFSEPAIERGYVVVIPEGMPPSDDTPLQVWEMYPGIPPDDPGYLASLVDWIGDEICVDLDRVYAAGFSNGATMTNIVACHTDGRFRAIGAVAAHRFPIRCPSGPVSVLGIHGSADTIVPYQGGPLLRRPEVWMPPVEETFEAWAGNGGCDDAPRLEEVVTDVVRRRWVRCAEGTQVELYTILGGGHSWPWVDDPVYPGRIDATTLILDFFDAN